MITVPCGHCMACRIKRTKEWSLRMLMENANWKQSVYVTLQYDEDNVPRGACGKLYLDKRDLTNFFKRLRKNNPDRKFKYYASGEYGDLRGRPHFHIILFGYSADDLELLEEAWQYRGHVHVGNVCGPTVSYVAGYCQKKLYFDPKDKWQDYGCLPLPYSVCSHGLGLDYFNRTKDSYLKDLSIRYHGRNNSIPRYFLSKDEKLKEQIECRNWKNFADNGFDDETDVLRHPEIMDGLMQHEYELRQRFKDKSKKF